MLCAGRRSKVGLSLELLRRVHQNGFHVITGVPTLYVTVTYSPGCKSHGINPGNVPHAPPLIETVPVTAGPSTPTIIQLVPPDPPAEEFVQLNGEPVTEIDTGAKSRRLLETNPFVAVRVPGTTTLVHKVITEPPPTTLGPVPPAT